MSKLKCIIVEDEPLAVKVLADYIAQTPFLELQGSFRDAILAAVNKVSLGPAAGAADRDFIFVPVQKKRVKVLFSDILYIESQREYVRIRTASGEWLTKMGTQEIEALLPSHLFRRVHRSYIVAVRRIEAYTAEMIEIGGESIPIGKGYKGTIRF